MTVRGRRRVDPRPDRQARRRPGRDVHTVMVREAAGVIVPVQFALFPLQPRWGANRPRQSPRPVFGIVQRWVVEGKGGEVWGEGGGRCHHGSAGAGRGEWAPGPAQPAPIPPSTPRSPSAARQGARLSASDPRGRREATGREIMPRPERSGGRGGGWPGTRRPARRCRSGRPRPGRAAVSPTRADFVGRLTPCAARRADPRGSRAALGTKRRPPLPPAAAGTPRPASRRRTGRRRRAGW